ncbi:MAG: glycosyltransferase family 4 protein [Bacteroidetes bacterium]|nr:glycosyltransferase family 4 protein [Bacteroidota bacterium]
MIPLSVLHVIWSAGMGGIGKIVYHLLEEQKKDSTMKVGLLIAKEEGELMHDFLQLKINMFIAGFKGGLQVNREVISKSKKAISEYDIIHFHTFNPVLAWAAHKSHKKIIYTEHGNFGIGRTATLNDKVVRKMQQYFLNNFTDAITYNSKFSEDVSKNFFGVRPKISKVIYNGVPDYTTKVNADPSFTKEPGTFLIVAIGRLAQVKRFDRLIDAFCKLQLPEARLIILGEGPEEQALKEQVQQLKSENRISFPGYGDSRALLSVCDICVAPSQGEAFGLVAIEAYQQGKKVIAFEDGGGLTEIIRPNDPQAIVSSVEELTSLLYATCECKNRKFA